MDDFDKLNFTDKQKELVAELLSNLSGNQANWLSKFLVEFAKHAPAEAENSSAVHNAPLLIVYGSESGNSENLAQKAFKQAKIKGFKPVVKDMFEIKPQDLVTAENIFIVISTWGEGDPPERATEFFKEILSDSAPEFSAKNKYAILALGDSSYVEFCGAGKKLDTKLEVQGAKKILDRKDCDVDFEKPALAYIEEALNKFLEVNGVKEVENKKSAPAASEFDYSMYFGSKEYTPNEPFIAELKSKVLLNEAGSEKEVYHIEIDLSGSGIKYEAGDALGVVPENGEQLVDKILEAVKISDEAIKNQLKTEYDITALTKPVVENYLKLAENKKLSEILNSEKFNDYIYGRDILDLITEHPIKGITGAQLTSVLRKLPPRLYSIASAKEIVGDEVHLTIGAVRFNAQSRDKKGVASTFFADSLKNGAKVKIYNKPNKNFRLPKNNDAPVIMVGPGTGIAPFRSFMQYRDAVGSKGKNWLFFGEQHFLLDFYYQVEWQDYKERGLLTNFDAAFSRDKPQKIYVQNRMYQHKKELYNWLEQGAYFYVCGDEKRMAKDVDAMLHKIIAEVSGKGDDAAKEYVAKMKKEQRYLRDVY